MSLPHLTNPDVVPDEPLSPQEAARQTSRQRIFRRIVVILTTLVILFAIIGFVTARHWLRQTMQDSLPQLDGSVSIPGLSAPVTIQRDAHGVPHIRAASLDDLLLAQGFVTAQDRLWQMDSLRRHASGTLAEILGPGLLAHDRLQRTLLIRASADRTIATLPPDQLHLLERYAAGVNASIELQRARLPLEFRLLRYQPAPWTPRDCLLVALVMFQDLTTSWASELSREALTARLPQPLLADLYPVVTWRDHPPAQPTVDLTAPQKDIPNVPLDESQTELAVPKKNPHNPKSGARHRKHDPPSTDPDDSTFEIPTSRRASYSPGVPLSAPIRPGAPQNLGAPSLARTLRLRWASRASATTLPPHRQHSPGAPSFAASPRRVGSTNSSTSSLDPQDLLTLQQTLRNPICEDCFAGSNNWVVSGTHTATGKPLLSNDMHLAHTVPGIWYEADLQAPTPSGNLHVTGVSLPGVPFIIVGHNDHVAWGFTNLGATVQDIYIEHTRGAGPTAQYQAQNGSWQPFFHDHEIIHVKGSKDVAIDIAATRHGTAITPILSSILPTEKRTLSLRWIIYDPAALTPSSFLTVNTATDAATLVSAFSTFGGPAQNLVYADDQGHIGYHAVGRIPIRGSIAAPSPISPVPTDALDPSQEWIAAIPYDKLPQALDPPNGILATANNRVTPDDYPFPITLNWGSPYRNQRIWKVLTDKSAQNKLTPADMLALQTDVYSDADHVIAQRLAYAIDHASKPALPNNESEAKRLRQAADLLRDWNGNLDANAAPPAIVVATRAALWPLLINPQASPQSESQPNPVVQTESGNTQPLPPAALYTWGNKAYAEEWLIMHTPARWLPKNVATWDDLLTLAVAQGLTIAHAPADLRQWRYGQFHPIEINHAIYSRSPLLEHLIGVPIGTGIQPQSGDDITVKQVGRNFGPSERFTADLADLDHSNLNLVLGQSANPLSPWFMDQWAAWYQGTTFPLPFSNPAVDAATTHTLTLSPH
jgi:penicillin amidase